MKINFHNRENLAFSRDFNATKHQRNPTHQTQAAAGVRRSLSSIGLTQTRFGKKAEASDSVSETVKK